MASTHHPGNPLSPADTYVPPFDPPPGGFGTPMTASKEPPRVNITKEVLSAFKGMGPSKVPAYQHAPGGKIPGQIRHQHFAPTGLPGSMPQYGHINGGGISILNSGGTNPLPSTIEGSSKYFQGSRHAGILEYYRKGDDLKLTQAVNQTRIHHSSHSAFLNKLDKDAMKNFKLVKCEYKPNQCPYKWGLRVLEQASHLPGARSLTHYFHELVRRNPLNLDPPDAILQAGEAETIDIVTASTAQMNDVMKLHQAALRHTTQQVPAASADAPDLTHPSSWPPMNPVETLDEYAQHTSDVHAIDEQATFDDLPDTETYWGWTDTGFQFLRVSDSQTDPVTLLLINPDNMVIEIAADRVRLIKEPTTQSLNTNAFATQSDDQEELIIQSGILDTLDSEFEPWMAYFIYARLDLIAQNTDRHLYDKVLVEVQDKNLRDQMRRTSGNKMVVLLWEVCKAVGVSAGAQVLARFREVDRPYVSPDTLQRLFTVNVRHAEQITPEQRLFWWAVRKITEAHVKEQNPTAKRSYGDLYDYMIAAFNADVNAGAQIYLYAQNACVEIAKQLTHRGSIRRLIDQTKSSGGHGGGSHNTSQVNKGVAVQNRTSKPATAKQGQKKGTKTQSKPPKEKPVCWDQAFLQGGCRDPECHKVRRHKKSDCDELKKRLGDRAKEIGKNWAEKRKNLAQANNTQSKKQSVEKKKQTPQKKAQPKTKPKNGKSSQHSHSKSANGQGGDSGRYTLAPTTGKKTKGSHYCQSQKDVDNVKTSGLSHFTLKRL